MRPPFSASRWKRTYCLANIATGCFLSPPSSRREREFNGRVELVVSLTEEGRNVMMSFPEQADAAAFRLAFKYFRRVEGTFRVNPKAKVESVQVRIYETGTSQPRATHSVAESVN